MAEKQKNKNGEIQQFTKSFILKILLAIMAIPLFSFTYFILSAYALKSLYSIMMIVSLVSFMVFLIAILFKGLSIAVSMREKISLFLTVPIVLGNIILVWFTFFVAPIMLIIVIVYAIFLMLRYKMINLPKTLTLLGFASIFVINFIIAQGYSMLSSMIEDNLQVNAQHYVLTSQSFLGDPKIIYLYECNSIGMMCEEIYAPRDYYDNRQDIFSLGINAENDFIIDVLVNNEVVYQHVSE